MTGVTTTWTPHSWPEPRGRTGMYCSASSILMGNRPSFTTLAMPAPIGTVHTSRAGAFQFARMLPQ